MSLPDNVPGAPGYHQEPPKLRRKPAVVLPPKSLHALQQGINLIANAIRPTLGPRPRLVFHERISRTEAAEILDDGATIARRITSIRPRGQDVGAMLIRQSLWKMHLEAGDGTATMAALYQAILNEGCRYITGVGCNAMLLRSGLQAALGPVLAELEREAIPLAGKDQLAAIARGICQEDAEMAGMLAEIFDIVGPDGLIVIEAGQRGQLEREYVDGTYWHLSGWLSRWFVTDKAEMRATFEDTAVLITDLSLKDPQQLVPVLNQCARAGIGQLVILAKEISDSVVGLLVTNNEAKTIRSMAVRAPKAGADLVAALEDMAVLTGGRVFYSAGKETLEDFRLDDLGYARRAWATESLFGIFGGKGDPRRVRQHMSHLRGILRLVESKNDKKNTQERLGRLSGSTAILRVGGVTPSEIEVRKTMAQRAVVALRNTFRDGVVAGGGAALLSAQAALQRPLPEQAEAAAARKILARALEEPMRVIARNAGAVPDLIVEKARAAPRGFGFDARSWQIVDMRQAGIVDSVRVLKTALEIAVSGAVMALTTDVIVHHSQPKESIDP